MPSGNNWQGDVLRDLRGGAAPRRATGPDGQQPQQQPPSQPGQWGAPQQPGQQPQQPGQPGAPGHWGNPDGDDDGRTQVRRPD